MLRSSFTMRKTTAAVFAAFCALVGVGGYLQLDAASPQTAPADAATATPASLDATLTKYCANCHNSRLKTAGLALDALGPVDAGGVASHAAVWEKVAGKLRTEEM